MDSYPLSDRASKTPASPIRRLAPLAMQAEEAGKVVYHLNIGQPDLEAPAEFLHGIAQYQGKHVAYESSEGNLRLRAAWARHMSEALDLKITPEQMLITMGASEALIFLFMTCCDPGDEVIIFDPTYANYLGFAAITGVELVSVPTFLAEDFHLPPVERLREYITSKTKAVLLCSPNNPTGTVYSREELRELMELCGEREVYLIVDETYRELVYDGRRPLSVLELDPENRWVVVVDSLSKRFSLCGARIGCMVTPNELLLAHCLSLAQARLAAPTVEQQAAAYMLQTISHDYVEKIRVQYEERRDTLFHGLASIKGVQAYCPGGAFYTVAYLPVDDAEQFAEFLLRDFDLDGETLFLAPARGFYNDGSRGRDEVRLAFVLKPRLLRRAIAVLEAGLEAYPGRVEWSR